MALAACSRGSAPHDPHTLVVMELGDAGQIEPLLTNQYYAFLYQNLIFDTLLGNGPDYRPTPNLATSWKSDPSGKIWTLQLRRGVRWSDGQPFTAADVAWTFAALVDPATGSPYNGQYTYIKRTVALGPYTVRFELAEPNATFVVYALQGQWIMPAHAFRGVAHAQIKNANFGEHPVGTGPYMLQRWNHDQECLLVANPHWWGGTPNISTVDVRIILQDQSRTDTMLDGAADFDDGIGPDAATRLERAPGLNEINIPDLYTRYVTINFRVRGLDQVTVRQAMLYAWDREAVAKGLRHGHASVANSVEPAALSYWIDPKVRPYPFDPARANALLDAAGWKRGSDGVRARGGVRLRFELLLPATLLGNDIAAAFQADMRAIGVAITIQTLDYATFIDRQNASNFQLAYTGWGGSPDPDMLTLLDSKQFPPTGNNIGFYHNPAVDRDLERGLLEVDPAKRRALYDDMQARTAADVAVLFGTNEYYLAAYRKGVHITGPILPGLYIFSNLPRWTIDP